MGVCYDMLYTIHTHWKQEYILTSGGSDNFYPRWRYIILAVFLGGSRCRPRSPIKLLQSQLWILLSFHCFTATICLQRFGLCWRLLYWLFSLHSSRVLCALVNSFVPETFTTEVLLNDRFGPYMFYLSILFMLYSICPSDTRYICYITVHIYVVLP